MKTIEDKPITSRERIRAMFNANATLPSLTEMSQNTGIPVGSISGEMAALRKEGWKFQLVGQNMGYIVFPAGAGFDHIEERPPLKPKKQRGKDSAYREQWMRKNARLINEIQELNNTIKYGLITIGLLSASVLAIALHLIISN